MQVWFLQVYLSDLTELFTWTCTRCDGLTKVMILWIMILTGHVHLCHGCF